MEIKIYDQVLTLYWVDKSMIMISCALFLPRLMLHCLQCVESPINGHLHNSIIPIVKAPKHWINMNLLLALLGYTFKPIPVLAVKHNISHLCNVVCEHPYLNFPVDHFEYTLIMIGMCS